MALPAPWNMPKRVKWLAVMFLLILVTGIGWLKYSENSCSAGRLSTYTERVWYYEPKPTNIVMQSLGKYVTRYSPSFKHTALEHNLDWPEGKLHWAYSSRTSLWFSFGQLSYPSPPPRDNRCWEFALSPTNELEQALAALPHLDFHGAEWSGWPGLLGTNNVSLGGLGGGSIRITSGRVCFVRPIANQTRCYLVQVRPSKVGFWGDSTVTMRHLAVALPGPDRNGQ